MKKDNERLPQEDQVVVGVDGVFVRNTLVGLVAGISLVKDKKGRIKTRFSTGPGTIEEIVLPEDAVSKLREILGK